MLSAHLLLTIALGRSAEAELARQIQYLTVENRILRGKLPKRIRLTEHERRRLIRVGRPLGAALKRIISVVRYDTFQRWLRRGRPTSKPGRVGRPSKPESLRSLVERIAVETDGGYTRILGELRKLGILSVSRTTVRNILTERGIEPAPDRGEPTWDAFLTRHAETLWACDFFHKRVLTATGYRLHTALVFLHIKTRRVIVSPATTRPDQAWAADQAERFVRRAREQGDAAPALVIRDNDAKFGHRFDEALDRAGASSKRISVRAPLLNAYVERWIKSIKHECLDHFIPIGVTHLDHIIAEYAEHHNTERPHQGMGNRPLTATGPPPAAGEIICRKRLGGVLTHYERVAA